MNDAWYYSLFRYARPAAPGWNLAKTLGQIAAFWLLFLVVIPSALVALEQTWGVTPFAFPTALAWIVLLLASGLGLLSGITMALQGEGTPLPLDAPHHLVVQGPYRHVRNPMAVAGLTQGTCVACLLGSWLSLGLVAVGFVVWNHGVRPIEERELEARYGAPYLRYRSAVRCWIPRIRGYRVSEDAGAKP